MAKISRTYRLSKEALEQIDQRDKSRIQQQMILWNPAFLSDAAKKIRWKKWD